jgi:hypothetical protein
MTTDLYTKAVLTVIAIALSGIAIQLTTTQAHAQVNRGHQHLFTESGALIVAICDPNGHPSIYNCAQVKRLER